MPIISSIHFPEIRAAISVEITARELPDTVIPLDLYQGEAERWAKRVDEQWATRAGDELRQLQTAIVLKTAALLIKAMPQLLEESFAVGESFKRQQVDAGERAEELASRALETLNNYLFPTIAKTKSLPRFFDTASGYRGY